MNRDICAERDGTIFEKQSRRSSGNQDPRTANQDPSGGASKVLYVKNGTPVERDCVFLKHSRVARAGIEIHGPQIKIQAVGLGRPHAKTAHMSSGTALEGKKSPAARAGIKIHGP